MKKLAAALALVLLVVSIAFAGVVIPIDPQGYQMSMSGHDPEFLWPTLGPPATVEVDGVLLTYNPETGLYHAAYPEGDTLEYNGDGTGTWTDWPPFPASGPPAMYSVGFAGGMGG